MDQLTHKTHTTTRGLTYAYYTAPAAPGKPSILFLHGFPSSSWYWTHQVAHFAPQGFGLVVPDLLGYGGTDKPADARRYVGTAVARDVVDLLDAEHLRSVVVVGHDWGALTASRMVNVFPERVAAVAFLALGYLPPNPSDDFAAMCTKIRAAVGRDCFGYWEYFSEAGADKMIEQNMDSFLSLFFIDPPERAIEHLCAFGGAKAWIESNRQGPLPAYVTPAVREHYKTALLKGGMTGPLQWYAVNLAGHNMADDATIPEAAYTFAQPVFFGGNANEPVCLPALGLASVKAYATGPVTYREFDSSHWVMLSHSEELNAELEAWIEGLPRA